MGKTIWYICQYAVPLKYGFGTRHFYLGKEMVKLGHKVSIISANYNFAMTAFPPDKSNYNYEIIDGIDVCWIRVNRYKKTDGIGRIISWFVFMWRLMFYSDKKNPKPDVIIVSSLSLLPILNGIILKRKFKAKLIFEIRDIWPQTIIDLGNYRRLNPFIIIMKMIEKIGYKNSDHIVATMPKADLHIARIIHQPFKFTCIPQGMDPNVLTNSDKTNDEFKTEYLPEEKFIVGYAGAIGLSNELETIIEAAKLLEVSNPEIHFMFLGDGPLKHHFREYTSDMSNITFIPKVNKLAVNSFLEKCDVLYDSFKYASIYKYGLSRNKWIDYMYSGRPLIVSFTGYLSLINEAGCGTAVPAEDIESLKEVLIRYSRKSKTELDDEGNRGKEFILKNRTFDILAKEYLKIIL
jgi:glycosyltransferase involved in cell wall biosynthesis